jgi:ribosome-binding factor A
MTRRIERLNELIREEISELIRRQAKDPRLDCFLTVTKVNASPDLRNAKVFISIMGTEEEKNKAMNGLASASGFFHRELMKRLSLRHTPQLSFHQDDSIERAARVLDLMKGIAASEDTLETERD